MGTECCIAVGTEAEAWSCHSLPRNAKVNNVCCHTCTATYDFMTWLLLGSILLQLHTTVLQWHCDLRGLRAKWRIEDPELQTHCRIWHFGFTWAFWVITPYSLTGGTSVLNNMLLPFQLLHEGQARLKQLGMLGDYQLLKNNIASRCELLI